MSSQLSAPFPEMPLRSLAEQVQSSTPAQVQLAQAFAFDDVARLTAALKRGDEAAYAWLHVKWADRINRYCFALASADESFAGEIAQATWLRLVRHVRVMNDQQALWNWLACAARHAASDLRRTKGRYFQVLHRFAEWWRSPADGADADGTLLTALDAALGKLSEPERALLESRYFAAESLEAIGARLGLSVRAVEGRLARARVRLREHITEELKGNVL